MLFCLLIANQCLANDVQVSKQRIIALSPHSVELLFAIGAGDRIVGALEYSDYPKAALDIPRLGNFNGIQIEKVVELQPDLIIAWKTGNKNSDLEKLQSLGFNIFYSHPQNISEISSELIKLGELTSLEENAKIAAKMVADKYQIIKAKYHNTSRIKTFYQLWHDPLRTIGANNWTDSLIRDCNGSNIFNDASSDYPVVSIESVLQKDPQVIIIPHHSGSKTDKSSIWDKWYQLSAVKNQHVTVIDGDLLHRFSPRALKGLEILCKTIDDARNTIK